MMQSRETRNRRKKKKVRRVIKNTLLFLTISIVGLLSYGGYLVYTVKSAADDSYNETDRNKSELRIEDVELGEDPVTILLMGIEDYQGDTGRSDVLLLYALNPDTKETAMVSIPRDTRTYLPVVGYKDKINHSYAFADRGNKEEAVIESVENLLDIPIDYYISTNFNGFEDAVDSLNGIDMNVPFSFKTYDTEGRWVQFEEGPMKMDGREALAYVRMRKEDPRGDFGRNERQRMAIKAMMDKATSFTSITRVDNMIKSVGENVQTNVTFNELLGLRNFYDSLTNKKTKTLDIKGEDQYINNIYYFIPYDNSLHDVSNELSNVLELENDAEENEHNNESP